MEKRNKTLIYILFKSFALVFCYIMVLKGGYPQMFSDEEVYTLEKVGWSKKQIPIKYKEIKQAYNEEQFDRYEHLLLEEFEHNSNNLYLLSELMFYYVYWKKNEAEAKKYFEMIKKAEPFQGDIYRYFLYINQSKFKLIALLNRIDNEKTSVDVLKVCYYYYLFGHNEFSYLEDYLIRHEKEFSQSIKEFYYFHYVKNRALQWERRKNEEEMKYKAARSISQLERTLLSR